MDNLNMVFKLKGMWDTFTRNHPMFPRFMSAVKAKGIKEGTIIEISITDPDGTPMNTNLKVSASDIELINTLMTMKQ